MMAISEVLQALQLILCTNVLQMGCSQVLDAGLQGVMSL